MKLTLNWSRTVRCRAVLLATLAFGAQSLSAATFTGTGFIDPTQPYSFASGVSPDGKTVVGAAADSSETVSVFRWTATGGLESLNAAAASDQILIQSGFGSASVSNFGLVAASTSTEESSGAYTIATPGALNFLPNGEADASIASAINADGSVVVGALLSNSEEFFFVGAKWTNGGLPLVLQPLPTQNSAAALDVSGDGSTAVGYSFDTENELLIRAVTWQGDSTEAQLLPTPDDVVQSIAYSISPNGSIIAGLATTSETEAQGVFWIGNTFQALEATGTKVNVPLGVANSGVAVGLSEDMSLQAARKEAALSPEIISHACIYVNGAFTDLQTYLTDTYRLDLTGWTLESATGISADGYVIVGYGIDPDGNQQGWVADITPPVTTPRRGGGGQPVGQTPDEVTAEACLAYAAAYFTSNPPNYGQGYYCLALAYYYGERGLSLELANYYYAKNLAFAYYYSYLAEGNPAAAAAWFNYIDAYANSLPH